MEVVNKSVKIAKYLGWKYVPHNNLEDFPSAGWWKIVGEKINGVVPAKLYNGAYLINNILWKKVCRNHTQLRFYNSFDELIPVLNKISNENLGQYMYSWEQCVEGDEDGCESKTQYNFAGISWDVSSEFGTDIDIELTLDPPMSIGSCRGQGIVKDTFEACVEAIEYINKIKEK